MYIEMVANRGSSPTILLRQSYREGKKVCKRTLANLTKWPPQVVEDFRILLRGGQAVKSIEDSFEVIRSLPHGHVAAVLASVVSSGLEEIIPSDASRNRELVIAMIASRIISAGSKLATARELEEETRTNTLGAFLGFKNIDEDDLYEAMDWLLARQGSIEQKLAQKHLHNGSLVLYDLTSTYFEGKSCPLARFGHSRDGKKDKLQIVFGLLCNKEGCPVSVEVFEGNTADSKTLSAQIEKIRNIFNLERVILVGDRGMITEAQIGQQMRDIEGLDWITALRSPAIDNLMEDGALQMSLFDKQDLGEITHPDYPDERLIACKNPLLADERARKREALLKATEKLLDKVVAATQRKKSRLKEKDQIGLRVGGVINRYKVGKHFNPEITEDTFSYTRNTESIDKEAALDGIYIIRTSLPKEVLGAEDTVRAYKKLSAVERAFRSLKSIDLKVRPIYHRLADRVRSHVLLCMLAYYVEWHMRQKLAPMLFDDDDKEAGEALRSSIVSPAERSPKAADKANKKKTEDNMPVHSFHTLMEDLATIVKSRIQLNIEGSESFDKITRPTPVQQRALDLLGVSL